MVDINHINSIAVIGAGTMGHEIAQVTLMAGFKPVILNDLNDKNRFTLRFFGVKIGKKVFCDTCWISSEFVEIGKNVIIGMGSTLLSFGIEQDKFILKKIHVEDNVVIGAKCVLLPGTIVKRNTKLAAYTYTNYNQILRENSVYIGNPAILKEE